MTSQEHQSVQTHGQQGNDLEVPRKAWGQAGEWSLDKKDRARGGPWRAWEFHYLGMGKGAIPGAEILWRGGGTWAWEERKEWPGRWGWRIAWIWRVHRIWSSFLIREGGPGKLSVRKVKAKESGSHCRRISQVVKTQDCRHLWTVWWFLLGHSA